MTKRFHTMIQVQAVPNIRLETIGDVEFMVAPTIAVMETVLNGFLLPASEIARFPEAWDGVPTTVGHPEDEYGFPASASTQDQLFRSAGWFFNTSVDLEDHAKLHGEIWINVENALEKGGNLERALSQLRGGYQGEVSSAFYADIEDTNGTFNGDEYYGIFRNIIPDHIAILLDEKGACSIEDGCGCPRANQDSVVVVNKERSMNRETMIAELVLCECCALDRAALEALDDVALKNMHDMTVSFRAMCAGLESQIAANDNAGVAGNTGGTDDDGGDDDDDGADSDDGADEEEDNDGITEESLAVLVSVIGEFGGLRSFTEAMQGIAARESGEREGLVTRITANSRLDAAMLEGMSLETLHALDADLIPTDYSGRAIRPNSSNGSDELTVMAMPTVA